MSEAPNLDGKELIRHLITDLVNQRDWEPLAQYFTDDFVLHAPLATEPRRGVTALRAVFDNLLGPFPDLKWEIQELIAEGDRVVAHYVMSGTHRGTFEGFTATGRTFAVEEVAVYHLADGKVAEAWLIPDTFGVGMQLGLVPEGAPPKFLQKLMMMKQRRQDAGAKP